MSHIFKNLWLIHQYFIISTQDQIRINGLGLW